MDLLKSALLTILLLNAIFWSIFPHASHCDLVNYFGIARCAPHWVHVLFGIACFAVAILFAQYDHVM